MGIVSLESRAAGLPVVASRIGGIPSFTEDGTDILHAEPGDAASMAAGLARVLDGRALAPPPPATRPAATTTGR